MAIHDWLAPQSRNIKLTKTAFFPILGLGIVPWVGLLLPSGFRVFNGWWVLFWWGLFVLLNLVITFKFHTLLKSMSQRSFFKLTDLTSLAGGFLLVIILMISAEVVILIQLQETYTDAKTPLSHFVHLYSVLIFWVGIFLGQQTEPYYEPEQLAEEKKRLRTFLVIIDSLIVAVFAWIFLKAVSDFLFSDTFIKLVS